MESKYLEINHHRLHYLEAGEGQPILFLHGVPASSYVWRQIIPYLAPLGRCIAPDLIGFGSSDKPNIAYTIEDHIFYIQELIKKLDLQNLILVMHGFGSIIGFNYAMEHEPHCRGLVFYEAFLRTLEQTEPALPLQEQIYSLQNNREENLLKNTLFYVEKMLQQSSIIPFNPQVLAAYSQPFKSGNAAPIIQYIKELSQPNEKEKLEKMIETYTHQLTLSSLPKLMLYSIPGFVTTISMVMWAKQHLSRLEVIDLGEELHFAQESAPQLMGEAMSVWVQALDLN